MSLRSLRLLSLGRLVSLFPLLKAGETAPFPGSGDAISSRRTSISSSLIGTGGLRNPALGNPGVGSVSIMTSLPSLITATVRPLVHAAVPVDRAEASAGDIQPEAAPREARLADQIDPPAADAE